MPRKKSPNSDAAKESFWRKAVQRQLESGLTQAAFCDREGLSQNSLSFWKRKLAKRDLEDTEQPATTDDLFVPAGSVAESVLETGRPIAEIDLHSGVVRIFAGVDRRALREIIAPLKEVTR